MTNLIHKYPRGKTGLSGAQVVALRVDNFSMASGAHRCLRGKSGAGKTTFLNVLAGILTPSQGQVRLGETDLTALGERDRDHFRAREIGVVFQTSQLLEGLSLLENLTLAQHFAGQRGPSARRSSLALLERLGLGARVGDKPCELSVGERQRVGIARAVCKGPSLILADEPTSSLDDDSAAQAIELLLEECKGRTLLVVSHDSRLIERFAGAVTTLENP